MTRGSMGRAATAAMVASLTLVGAPVAWAGHDHGGGGGPDGSGRTGVLIVDHGEPPEYNADTYESFRAFMQHLVEMGVIPGFLETIDTGTILQDPDCYACPNDPQHGPLINAWLGEYTGVSVWSAGFGDDAPAHYFAAGAPGAGEPDLYEHGGLSTWNEWELMGGRSPNYDQKLAKKRVVIKRLRERYGKRIAIAVGYGIDPRIDGEHQDIHTAVHELLDREVKRMVVVYHGVGFSDLMQTHMVRHEIEHSLAEHEVEMPLTYAEPLGSERAYIRSVVAKAQRELARLPRRAPVALHLSGHGLPTGMCGDYDCGADAYHERSADLFQRTEKALGRTIDRPGETGIFGLYGDGATDADDPEDLVDSPIEALDKRAAAGFEHVVDIPFEFDSDSRDTLIVLRRGYERPLPDWNANYVSEFDYEGMEVRITEASYGSRLKTLAFERVAKRAIAEADPGA